MALRVAVQCDGPLTAHDSRIQPAVAVVVNQSQSRSGKSMLAECRAAAAVSFRSPREGDNRRTVWKRPASFALK